MMAKILVVDDEPHMTYVVSLFLTRRGHDVTRAEDGAVASELLRAARFDLLITDVDMPRMDGLSLIDSLDAVSSLRGMIVLTGRNDHESIVACRNLPHLRVATKPFSPSRLADMVDDLLACNPGAVGTALASSTMYRLTDFDECL